VWAGEAGCGPASGPALSAGMSLAPVLEWALGRPVRRRGPSRGCVTVRRPGRTRASRGSASTRSTLPAGRSGRRPRGRLRIRSASRAVHRRESRGRLPLAVRQRKVRVQASIPASRRMRSRRGPMPAGFGCRGRRTTRLLPGGEQVARGCQPAKASLRSPAGLARARQRETGGESGCRRRELQDAGARVPRPPAEHLRAGVTPDPIEGCAAETPPREMTAALDQFVARAAAARPAR